MLIGRRDPARASADAPWLAVVEGRTGRELWRHRFASLRDMCAGANVVVALADGRLSASDLESGRPLWTRVVDPPVEATKGLPAALSRRPLIGGVIDQDRLSLSLVFNGGVEVIDAQTGVTRRTHSLPRREGETALRVESTRPLAVSIYRPDASLALFAILEGTRWRFVTVPAPLFLRAGGLSFSLGLRDGQHQIRAYWLHEVP